MFVVGGSAIALAYSPDRAKRDVDAVFEPKMRVNEEAKRMVEDLGLPGDWLDDGVKELVPDFGDDGQQTMTTSEGIHVVIPSPEYLFAMKAVAARIGIDDVDLRLLADRIGVTTADQAYQLVERFYRVERISPKAGFFIQAMFPTDAGVVLPPPV